MLKKLKVLDLPCVYTANAFIFGGRCLIGAGSERTDPSYLFDLDTLQSTEVARAPGGMMSFLPVPEDPHHLVSVMGLFPPFISRESGIYVHSNQGGSWHTRQVIDLPFSHRCEILRHGGRNHLFVATVSRHKANPTDWSQPGELYHVDLANVTDCTWKTTLLKNDLVRNHGMIKTVVNGIESVCISGETGIFAIQPGPASGWKLTRLFESEVSEFAFIDLDGDGVDELATIEPFHGNRFVIHKKIGSVWKEQFSSPLSFGHGLSAGIFYGQPVVVVGNRTGPETLELHRVRDLARGLVETTVIEEHATPTQTKVFTHHGRDYILSANQLRNEVALYYQP